MKNNDPHVYKGKLHSSTDASNQIIYRKGSLYLSSFSVNITNYCPNDCVFCIRDLAPGWNPDDNLFFDVEPSQEEIYLAVANELKKEKKQLDKVRICGYGEPLLFPNKVLAVSRAVKSFDPNINVELITSGWPYYYKLISSSNEKYKLINYELVSEQREYSYTDFKTCGIDTIKVSLNAASKEQYQKIVRPSNNDGYCAFELTLKFIEDCSNSGIKTIATIVKIATISEESLFGLADYFSEKNIELKIRPFIH